MNMSVSTDPAQRMPAGPPVLPDPRPPRASEVVAASAQNIEASAHPLKAQALRPGSHIGDMEDRRRNLSDAIEQLNEQMRQTARNLNFSIDKDSGRTVITVRNSHSGEIVRQIPDEVVLRVAHNIDQVKGMLVNEKS